MTRNISIRGRAKRASALAVVTFVAMGGLVACGSGGGGGKTADDGSLVLGGDTIAKPDTIAACKQEGSTLTYYSSAIAETFQPVMDQFKADTGISMAFTRLTTGEVAAKIEAEKAANNISADVISVGDPDLIKHLKDIGAVQDYTLINEDRYKEAAKTNPNVAFAKPTTVTYLSIAYNTALVKEPPKTWDDLLDAKWKGKMGMTAVATGLSSIVVAKAIYDELGDTGSKALGDNGMKIYASVVPLSQAVAKGEVLVGITDVSLIEQYKSQGNPVDWVDIPTGTPSWTNSISLTTNAKHEACGRIWIEWMTSKYGAEVNFKYANFLGFSQLDDVPKTAVQVKKRYDIDINWLFANRNDFIKKWGTLVKQS